MEVLARDLKALGLYAARSLSYEGIECELIEHRLTPEQVRIYDAYAGAFQVIHNNLNAALQAANVTGETGTLNSQAKSAARAAFESAKQRFYATCGTLRLSAQQAAMRCAPFRVPPCSSTMQTDGARFQAIRSVLVAAGCVGTSFSAACATQAAETSRPITTMGRNSGGWA
jgi:hypothetical protein